MNFKIKKKSFKNIDLELRGKLIQDRDLDMEKPNIQEYLQYLSIFHQILNNISYD